jgi:hypothetical protein
MSERWEALRRVKLYLDSWNQYPAKELGEQPTKFVHELLSELYEAALATPETPAPCLMCGCTPCSGGLNCGTPALASADNYVAWCRYKGKSIVTCDSDAPKAFKVYRHPATASVEAPACRPGWVECAEDKPCAKHVGHWAEYKRNVPQAPVSLVKALIEKWRKDMEVYADCTGYEGGNHGDWQNRGIFETLKWCADELESALEAEHVEQADIEALKRDAAFWRDVAEKMGYKLVKGSDANE